MDADSRQAGIEIAEEVEITPRMIEAGVSSLFGCIAPDDCYYDHRDLVRLVYSSMEKCSPSLLNSMVGSAEDKASPSSL